MFQLLALRCVGLYETGFTLDPSADVGMQYQQRRHPTLVRRFMRFLNCPGLKPGRGHMLDDFKSTTSHYFIEVGRFRWVKHADDVKPHEEFIPGSQFCVYLGKYPVYWNHQLNQLSYAHNMGPGRVFALDGAPFVEGVDILWIRDVSPETRAFFLTPQQLKLYDSQAATLAYRKKWQADCKARMYPPDPTMKQMTVYSPLGPLPWIGKPMRQLTLPTPERPPSPPSEPVEPGVVPAVPPVIRITLDFSLKEFPPPEGFNLFITL